MKKKIAVITGGSSGIGLAVAKKLLTQNYKIANLDIQPPHEPIDMDHYAVDITQVSQINHAVQDIVHKYKKIGYLFANAGIHYSGNLEQTSLETIEKVIDINLKGILYTLKSILPLMREKQFGRIVLDSSDQALIGKPNSTIYGCTKAAIAQLAKSIAIDYTQYNIHINAICPGTIDTPLYRQAVKNFCQKSGKNEDDVHRDEAAQHLVNRLGQPEEVANLVAFLFSDEANFIVGSSISIDGGLTIK